VPLFNPFNKKNEKHCNSFSSKIYRALHIHRAHDVRRTITLRYCAKKAKHINEIPSSSGSAFVSFSQNWNCCDFD